MKIRIALAGLVAAISCGCAAASDPYRVQNVRLESLMPSNGMVILSGGAPSDCLIMSMFIKVMEKGKKYSEEPLALLPIDSSYVASEFPDHRGHVFAIPLPAGDFYLTTYLAHPQFRAVVVPRSDFSVTAGKVTYLGNFYMTKHCTVGSEFEIRDEQARDFALIAQKNPALAASEIDKQLLTLKYVPAD